MIVNSVVQHILANNGAFCEISFIDKGYNVAKQFADYIVTELGPSNGIFFSFLFYSILLHKLNLLITYSIFCAAFY